MTGRFGRLQVEPTAAQHYISEENARRAEDRKEAQAIKNTTAEGVAADCDTLNQPPKNYPLHASRHNGSDTEDGIPVRAIALRLRTEFKGHAAQSQSKKHDNERNIERGHQNAIGEGKACKKRDTGHDEPGFVAVPGWRARVDHMIPGGFVRLQ